MKRIHLFEFEDFLWFPHWIRVRMTRLIIVMHKMLKTGEELADLLAKTLKKTNSTQIIDLCSGGSGPMPEAMELLKKNHGIENVDLTLTDLYPNLTIAEKINSQSGSRINYETTPVDATKIGSERVGLRTIISGFHHMDPNKARLILESAFNDKQPICIFEISDNSFPAFLWWTAFPINIITCLFITPFVKPFSWQQLVFTYLIPIIPICFAWDGAVSNARTYTLEDMDELLEGLKSDDYNWEKGVINGKSKKMYLIGNST